jgi:Stage II sporulation protein E (SpoIIE)
MKDSINTIPGGCLRSYRCPAFSAACQILRLAVLIVSLCIAVRASKAEAQAPASHPEPSGSAVQTIDVANHSFAVDLDGPWRFHAGDDPDGKLGWADPGFDDSSWASVRPNPVLPVIGIPFVPWGYVWVRIHLHVPAVAGRMALAVYPHSNAQYEIFVNGSPIGSTPGMATRTFRFDGPSAVALTRSGDIVLAIRFLRAQYPSSNPLPFARVSLGSFDAVQTAAERERLDVPLLGWGNLARYVCLSITLLIAITAMILYTARRDHDEYLWLGILCLCFALYALIESSIMAGWLPSTLPAIFLDVYSGWCCIALTIEFVMRFTRVRWRWPIRMLQGLILIGPVMNFIPATMALYAAVFIFVWIAMTLVQTACVVSAFRHGMADAGLFLVPSVVHIVLDLAWAAALTFPHAVPWGMEVYLGPVGIHGNYLAQISFNLGIVAVVLYRFMRVTRDEARVAAELEAARTVQQILVPEETPNIPGFSIQAVYHPAGQVGGDFYQVLPMPNGGLLAVIGDVSGKGMPAAMTVSLLVGTIRTVAHYTHDPAGILTAMNQQLIGRGSGFTTALVLHLDPDGTLTAANAGHIAPYANGKELGVDNGLPLGITAAAAYCNSTLHLEHGTALTLLTDGVVEAQNAKGELFGFDRTAEIISSQSAQKIANAAQTFGQTDDITVLSLALVAGV